MIILYAPMQEIKEGDVLRFQKSNKYRHKIFKVLTSFSAEIEEYVRPSRGFAKHNRRKKMVVK